MYQLASAPQTSDSLAYAVPSHGLRVIEGGRAHVHCSGRARHRQSHTLAVFLAALATMLSLAAIWRHVDVAYAQNVEASFAAADIQTVTVMPGDTLWSIATAHPVAGCSASEVVHHIMQANDISADQLMPGMLLEVPLERS